MTADAGGVGAPRFDVVLRGYDRRQVDEHVARLQRVMSRMRADLELVRSQPIPVVPGPPPGYGRPGAGQPPTGPPRPAPRPRPDQPDMIGSFTDRMQSILQAAEEEAAEIRNKARAGARAETESVRAELADLVRQRDAVMHELTRLRGQLEGMLHSPTARMAPAPAGAAAQRAPGVAQGAPKPRPRPTPAGRPNPPARQGPGQQPAGQQPAGQQVSGQQVPGQQPGSGQPSTAQPTTARSGLAQPGRQPATAQASAGRGSSGQPPSDQAASGQSPAGSQPSASGRPVQGPSGSAQAGAPRPASSPPAFGQPASGSKAPPPGRPEPGRPEPGRPEPGQPSAGQKPSVPADQNAPGQNAGQKPSGQKPSGQGAPGQNGSARTENGSVRHGNGQRAGQSGSGQNGSGSGGASRDSATVSSPVPQGVDAGRPSDGGKQAKAAHRLPTGAYPEVGEQSSMRPRSEPEAEPADLFRPPDRAVRETPPAKEPAAKGDVEATMKVGVVRPSAPSDATVGSPTVKKPERPADTKGSEGDGDTGSPDRSSSTSRSG